MNTSTDGIAEKIIEAHIILDRIESNLKYIFDSIKEKKEKEKQK